MATTVQISDDIWEKLNRRKDPGESFDDTIRELLENGDGGDG